ncbi:hypothetical protein DITRI_Ditri15bG0124300 [Diplodiscus trichospermus]
MGQAFRRASGRIRSLDQPQPTKTRRPLGPTSEQKIAGASQYENPDHDKPGGKLEMGEAFVAENPTRPLPKLRNTTPESGRYEERPAPLGTLNVKQLQYLMLLHQGKADDHNGPMDVQQIAEKFRLDLVQVQRIVQFMSLPPEDIAKQKKS